MKILNKNISNAYIYSHEVIIKGKIPIEYIRVVLIPNEMIRKLKEKPKYYKNTKKSLKILHDKNIKMIGVAKHPNNFHKYFMDI